MKSPPHGQHFQVSQEIDDLVILVNKGLWIRSIFSYKENIKFQIQAQRHENRE